MSKKNRYDELSKKVIVNIGSKDNISYFAHCTTRLRFNLKDRSLVNLKEIEAIPSVLGTQWSNEELQIIIGPQVADAYAAICEEAGLAQLKAIDENIDGDVINKKFTVKGLFTGILDAVSGSITPLIPMMIAGGMIKILYIIGSMVGFLSAESSTYQVLNWVGDAFVYFFPIFIGATAAKKFGANQGLGMLLGGVLVYPSFIEAVNAGTKMTIFGLPIYMTNYSSTVIPIILCVWVMSKVQKFVGRHCPDIIRSFTEPLVTLLVMLPVTLVAVAPLGYYIGTFVAMGVAWLYNTIGFVGVTLLCTTLPLLIMTGMHTMMTPYWVTAFTELGKDPFFLPAMIVSNMNQATACAAVAFRAKSKQLKSTASSCAVTAYVAGVTEPALFGVTLKYKKPLYAAMIGNAAGGLILGLFKVSCYAFPGSGGIFAIPTFVGPAASNLIFFLIALAAGMIVTFIMTCILGFKEEE